ncbi:MAG: flavodoxin domain-containing protein [Bacteroidales bacterium]|nr:flavodoxin domain-containing protein [Bacteroidales bacterium]
MENKCLIVYESIYNGNTEKLARVMAHKLGCRFIRTKKALTEDLSQYKTIGFGSGIYFGSHHPDIFEVAEKLDHSAQDVFLFSSRGAPILGKYHQPLKNLLVGKGKKVVGEFSVRGYDETGPWVIIGGGNCGKPDEKDLKEAVKFVQRRLPQYCVPDYYKKIGKKSPIREGFINTYRLFEDNKEVLLKGDFVTINHSLCNGCGKCLKVCPLKVFELNDNKAVPQKELDCTLCRLCEINCVKRAISLHYNWRDTIKVAIRHGKKVSL